MPAEGPQRYCLVLRGDRAVALTVQVIAWSGNDGQPVPAPMIGWSLLVADAAVPARRPTSA